MRARETEDAMNVWQILKVHATWRGLRSPRLAIALLVSTLVAALPVGTAWAKEAAPDPRAGDHYVALALRYVRAHKPMRALALFEKALPYKNTTSDIFYNLTNVADALHKVAKVAFYGQGFLYLESDTKDARMIRGKVHHALRALRRTGDRPSHVLFAVTPPGVTVLVDHVPLTDTGGKAVTLPPGTYHAHAEKAGYVPWNAMFTVAGGKPLTVKGALVKKIYHGTLKIITDPPDGVKVYIDDKLVGTTPLPKLITLETRRYLVRFAKPGYDRWIRYVDISRQKTYVLKPVMEHHVGGAAPEGGGAGTP